MSRDIKLDILPHNTAVFFKYNNINKLVTGLFNIWRYNMCTEFLLPGQKEIRVSARTMDYTRGLESKLVIYSLQKNPTSIIFGSIKILC